MFQVKNQLSDRVNLGIIFSRGVSVNQQLGKLDSSLEELIRSGNQPLGIKEDEFRMAARDMLRMISEEVELLYR